MVTYISTRGDRSEQTFSQIILKGIAKDGGLFVPKELPHIDLSSLLNKNYVHRAEGIINAFQPDFSQESIHQIITQAYGNNFDNPDIARLVHLKNKQYVQELWHGPTAAFKDMALQIMPLFFSEAVKTNNAKRQKEGNKPLTYLVLVATSGDTGKAALEGYKDKEFISIMVFYPFGHVSQLQQLQMSTQEGKNVNIFAIRGDFDDTQRLVKDIFNDSTFNNILKQKNIVLSSANSINWGRLLPQIVYHISGYIDLVNQKKIVLGDEIDIAVPTGNFGNILAAYYAKKMGLPIRKLICASNANNVLTDFLTTGVYSVTSRKLVQTPSPSMDILIASNIERLLFEVTRDPEKVEKWMKELQKTGEFEVDNKTKTILQKEFIADWVSNEECLENINYVFQSTHYLLDPHTSVAQKVAERYIASRKSSVPVIICSTAHWAKFAKDVYLSLFPKQKMTEDEFALIEKICLLSKKISAPVTITSLKEKKERFKKVIEKNIHQVEQAILANIKLPIQI